MNASQESSCTIKAIETYYKGYRFRSRLEARWAVFFDALGLRWEYEHQGIKLDDGTYYLPDFYLPDQDTYIEIKPRIDYRSRSIYMAGKFSTDWRTEIAPGFRFFDNNDYPCNPLPGFHEYIGPFRYDDSGHGVITINGTHGVMGYDKNDDGEPDMPTDYFHPQDIFYNCLSQIKKIDTFFAWIDSLDCYGTIAEIGYAKALGKEIFIGIDENLSIPTAEFYDPIKPHNINKSHDLWFVEMMANKSLRAKSAKEVFYRFFVNLPEQFDKISQIKNSILIAGNPYPGEYLAYQLRYGVINSNILSHGVEIHVYGYKKENKEITGALLKARSARFEHGERP